MNTSFTCIPPISLLIETNAHAILKWNYPETLQAFCLMCLNMVPSTPPSS